MNSLELLKRAGLVHDFTEGLDLDSGPMTFYCGFDPTAESLHVGHLSVIRMIQGLQSMGHRPIVLIGNGTAPIGDPSGRLSGRDELKSDFSDNIQKQILSLLPEGVSVRRNKEWFNNIGMLEFLEEFGKFFRLSDMLSKESVKQRMNSDEGMSLNEFLYQSLQAMDFMLLSKFMDCKLQIGGSDQWGNILSGVTLVRKMTGAKVHGLTFPLLTDSRGQKFGKSSSNKQIWLNPDLTSPFDFFQFWFNLSDLDAIKLIDVFLDLSVSERKDLDLVTDQHPAKRTIQKRLAFEMTKWVHGEGLAEISRFISTSLTSERITKDQLSFAEENFDSLPNLTLKEDENPLMSTVLADSGLARSRSDAKRKIKEGCVFSNKARLAGDIHSETFMMSNPCIIQLGKKHLIILKKET